MFKRDQIRRKYSQASEDINLTLDSISKVQCKALGKLGNIVAETLFPTNVSPCFQEWANSAKHYRKP
jgi:organic hydroperoxide reductase OsmC/OhrA